jgi:outer membrane protein assembly factor BamB
MKRPNGLIIAIACCLILGGAGRLLAQDWPQWRGPNRDGKATGFKEPQTWPKALTQKWKVTVGLGDSTPALVGDKLYVFARQDKDEVTVCLEAATGKEVWKHKDAVAAIAGPSARQHSGPRSSPAVADGKVVTLGVNGILSCLDAANGNALWSNNEYKGAPRFYTAVSPMIVDGMVVAQLGSEGSGALVALDLATGKEKWKWTGDGPGYASPVLVTVEGTKQVVTLTSKKVVGVGLSDGKLLWEIAFEPRGMAYNAATPIVDGQTVIFTGQGRGTKAVKIEKNGDAFAAKDLWSNPDVGTQFNSPVLKDGLLYGISDKGNLFCIDAKTGKTAWTDTAKRGNYGAILDAGTVVLALPNNSELVVVKPGQKEYAEVAKFKVAESATYAHPVIVGNGVLVKDQDALTLWSLE